MSLRHTPRQAERDVVIHDSHSVHTPHPHALGAPPPHAQSLPPHSNGNISNTPAPLTNGASHGHPHQIVSPSHVSPSVSNPTAVPLSIQKLTQANEQTWLLIGRVAEQMNDHEHALSAYENALRHNPNSLTGLTQVAGIARIKENYPKAVEYFKRVLHLQQDNGEVWSALGHCYLMQDDLQKAYSAYQQALYLLPNPKEDPKLWYGIGILYDRYGSLDHAEDAFASVLRMDKGEVSHQSNEILFRLGIIYKQQGKYVDSLRCFEEILRNPPSPLAHADIWFQIGHVYEQQKDHLHAKDAYERVVAENPSHAKVLQQLGWLYHQDGSTFQNQDLAIQYLTKSLEADPSDAQSWYLLGRAYMAGQKYNKAYEAYQQAVYRDGRNPTFWCSIGVLYFQINQFHDALDAYSRAIRINPYISEVWFDLGSLYESCNNQISDAIDAYARAAELDPMNPLITRRLQLLKEAQATGSALPAAPGPQDVHPTAYASAVVPPPGPPMLLQATPNPHARSLFRSDSRGPLPNESGLSLPPPPQTLAPRASSPGPFRGGPPPPVVIDESRHAPNHTPLAPMDVDRPPLPSRHNSASYPPRDASRGPAGQSLLLHHPVPQQQYQPEEIRGPGSHGQSHPSDPYHTRPLRVPSTSTSPAPSHSARPRSPGAPPYEGYNSNGRGRVGPGQTGAPPSQRSPRAYVYESAPPSERQVAWDRPRPHTEHRDWERERRSRHSGDYPSQQPMYAPRGPSPPLSHRSHTPRDRSPTDPSPRPTHPGASRSYWEAKPSGPGAPPGIHLRHSPPPPPPELSARRYDPRFDGRDQPMQGGYEREIVLDQRQESRSYAASPEGMRNSVRGSVPPPPPPHIAASTSHRGSESPRLSQMAPQPEPNRRRRTAKDKDTDSNGTEPPKKERKRRAAPKKAKAEDQPARTETPKPFGIPLTDRAALQHQAPSFKVAFGQPPSKDNSELGSSHGSSRSGQPSPTTALPPARVVDEDYDEGVADALMGLAAYRPPEQRAPSVAGSSHSHSHSPLVAGGNRQGPSSPRASIHRGSISSHSSPPLPPNPMKRPLSPGSDEMGEPKRSRVEVMKRRVSSPSSGRRSPNPSLRPSPIPFRTQPPASHSPETRQVLDNGHGYPPSPPLPAVLPPHPRPLGAGLSSHSRASQHMTLPPIATLSPTSSGSPPGDDRMHRDVSRSRSTSPPHPPRSKLSEVLHHPSRSPPTTRATPLPGAPKSEPVQ
ncbi:hypothetical protein JAAARDRAFT_196330 [Jaapia argillacea MUCL 33604]|uniref:Cytochrome c-type biogenesis protein H TPR domain-containing protein n=1 Tax=Jaapia argillacea MUCL 33604 TaxID=933084 RepID=A0A067PJA0_9AGAM|nr:hypothetical protein JAAARDRAFT_196330 [Jaapia argillacea MUCL 33604]